MEEPETQLVKKPFGSESTDDFLNASKPNTSSFWEDDSMAFVHEKVMTRRMKTREQIDSITTSIVVWSLTSHNNCVKHNA